MSSAVSPSSSAATSGAPLALSTYPTEKLIHLWRREELTVEQMIGHLLQHIAALEAQGQALQKQMHQSAKL